MNYDYLEARNRNEKTWSRAEDKKWAWKER